MKCIQLQSMCMHKHLRFQCELCKCKYSQQARENMKHSCVKVSERPLCYPGYFSQGMQQFIYIDLYLLHGNLLNVQFCFEYNRLILNRLLIVVLTHCSQFIHYILTQPNLTQYFVYIYVCEKVKTIVQKQCTHFHAYMNQAKQLRKSCHKTKTNH